jgi:NAD(P)-dependent dehydrogenase (short-subunit alcohol dehydrogenase family)
MKAMLDDKVCLIAGASQGMGRVTALEAARQGARVIVAARRQEACEAVAAEIAREGGQAHAHPVEATDAASVERLFGWIGETFGRLDLAFNNVGKQQGMAPLHEIPFERWDRCLAVNLSSVFYFMKYEAPLMMKAGGGVIINNSSAAGIRGVKGMIDYSAVKAGVIALTKSAALDYGRENIRVNCIVPGIIQTEAFHQVASHPEWGRKIEAAREGNPLGLFGDMQDVANLVTWLMSEKAKYVNGVAISIDGGDSAK